jgi:hypothetical protein
VIDPFVFFPNYVALFDLNETLNSYPNQEIAGCHDGNSMNFCISQFQGLDSYQQLYQFDCNLRTKFWGFCDEQQSVHTTLFDSWEKLLMSRFIAWALGFYKDFEE